MNKNNLLLFGIFLTGILSVTISNIFGGYYYAVAAIAVILSTMYIFGILDKGTLVEDKLSVALVAVITGVELLLFIVNDIMGKTVYVKGDLGFFGLVVLGSQLLAVISLILHLVRISIGSLRHKETIELVENHSSSKVSEEVEEEEDELEISTEGVEEIKKLPNSTIRKQTPFMEEEK